MALKDHIKGNGSSPVSKTSHLNSNLLSINSDDIDTILWYLTTRKANDKNGDLLGNITNSNGSYIDISPIFIGEMKILISELCEKVKLLDIKDGRVDIKIETNNENVNINQTTACFKLFFKDVLTFFGKDVQYDNIFII